MKYYNNDSIFIQTFLSRKNISYSNYPNKFLIILTNKKKFDRVKTLLILNDIIFSFTESNKRFEIRIDYKYNSFELISYELKKLVGLEFFNTFYVHKSIYIQKVDSLNINQLIERVCEEYNLKNIFKVTLFKNTATITIRR